MDQPDSFNNHEENGDRSGEVNGFAPSDAARGMTPAQEAKALLTEMTERFRRELPDELRAHFDPQAPRVHLETEDTRRVADGYLPLAWYDRAAQVTGPPSWQVAAMEAPGPGMRWPGGRPEHPEDLHRLYEMQVDWLAKIAWDYERD